MKYVSLITGASSGDSTWRALALEVLRIEDGSITEIVAFPPDSLHGVQAPDDDGRAPGDSSKLWMTA